MIILKTLIIILLILSVAIPQILIKLFGKTIINDRLNKARKFREIQNFIEITKDQTSVIEKFLIFGTTALIALFLGLKVTNSLNLLIQIFSGAIILMCLSFYVSIIKFDRTLIQKLYILKDNQ